MNQELSDVQAGFRKGKGKKKNRKGKGTRDQIANMHWIIEKAREFQKNICFCFIDYMLKVLTRWITENCGKFIKKTTLPASWENCMQVKKQQLELNMEQWTGSKLWKKYVKAVYILSPCLFNLYAEYIMRNAGLNEAQAGIKIAGRNINNLRYADDTTLMAKSEEELKGLLMKVKEESEKAGWNLNIQKMKIMASNSITHGK